MTSTNVPDTAPVHLTVVGGGPRGIGVLERLAANADLLDGTRLVVDVIDPHAPGAGRIWSTQESPLLLMNSRARDVTIFTDDSVRMDGPVTAGPTLAQWAAQIRDGVLPFPTAATDLRGEIEALDEDSFASRRLQGVYLEWFTGRVLAALPNSLEVRLHRSAAVSIERRDGEQGSWEVRLADGRALHADLLVLALGHTDARLSPRRHAFAAFARRHGGVYVPPSQARDADLDALAPGQRTIVRGMGLGFVDIVSLLTEGRGGRFEAAPHPGRAGRLRYVASGREPHLAVGSRRGAPYHSKVSDEAVPAGPRDLTHLTEENVRAREDANGHVRFAEDVLPLVAADIHRAVPAAPAPEQDPDLRWLDDPLAWLIEDEPADPSAPTRPCDAHRLTRDAVVRHIENDLRSRVGSAAETAPERALFQMMLRIHGALVDLLPPERLHPDSAERYPAWWQSVFSFVDSGPPPHRLEQLLALERAGIVEFLGPRVRVRTDEEAGCFVAEGATGTRVEATALVDAFLPEQTLAESTAPLLRELVGAGAGASRDALRGREAVGAPGRAEIDAEQRLVRPDGTPHDTVWATGPWTSELPIGAFARPHANAPAFRRNDALARDVLREAATHVGRPTRGTGAEHTADSQRTVLGIYGPGRIGSAIGRLGVRSGLDVRIAGRVGDEELRRRVPGARAVSLGELTECDVVVLAVPLHVALDIDPACLAGAIVIDATNAWGDEDAARLAAAGVSSSEAVAAHLDRSRVVKSLNHIGYHDVEEQAHRRGTGRRALAIAGNEPGALEGAATVLSDLGFEPIELGPLARGVELEPGGPLFAGWSTAAELEAALAHRRERARVA